MKHLLTLLLVFNTLTSFGQGFLSDSKKWNDLYSFYTTCNCSMHETHSYFLDGDSVINGYAYKILFDSTFRATSYSDKIIELTKKGFIRENNSGDKIFYIENGTTDEIKIYDFGFLPDSSLTIGLYTYTVHSTDSIEVFGEKRKILYLSGEGDNGLCWISGIGSNRGLFYFQYQDALLLCVKENNDLIYKNIDDYDCVYYNYASSIIEAKTTSINIFPNPACDNIMITKDEEIGFIELFNSTGALIISLSPNATESFLDLYGLEKGIYFIRIDDETIKIIKE